MTSDCWARKASPSFWVQSSLSFIMMRTCGNATIDFTLGSHSCGSSALASASPLRSLFFAFLLPTCRLHNFQGVRGRHQGLDQQFVRIEGDGSDQGLDFLLLERLVGGRRGSGLLLGGGVSCANAIGGGAAIASAMA